MRHRFGWETFDAIESFFAFFAGFVEHFRESTRLQIYSVAEIFAVNWRRNYSAEVVAALAEFASLELF